MNSVSPGTVLNRPAFQSFLACSIRSGNDSRPRAAILDDRQARGVEMLIEKNEGAHHAPLGMGQRAADFKGAQITRARNDDEFERVARWLQVALARQIK